MTLTISHRLALTFPLALAACSSAGPTTEPVDVASLSFTVASRTSQVATEIQAANAALPGAIRAEKYQLMKASPYAFYRGTNHLYWKDLGHSPDLSAYGGLPSTRTWLGGDMHVDNTGAFDDDHGDIVFAINDFDEAIIADYQLDLWRMATSLVLVVRDNGGFSAADEAAVVDALSEHYLDAMASYAGTSDETTRRFMASNTYGLLDDFLGDVAAKDSRKEMLDAWTVAVGGVRRLNTSGNPDLAPVSAAVDADIRAQTAAYQATLSGGGTSIPASYFQVKSVAARLHAGIGSLGAARYYVLIEGATTGQDDDRILDVKAQRAPTAWAYASPAAVTQTDAACGGNMALRTVLAHKALGYRVDDYLGWMKLADGVTYSVRERSPYKETFDTTQLTSLTRLTNLAEQWGELLATQHARADRDWDASVVPQSVDGQINALTNGDHAGFRARTRAVALAYADQVDLDYASFLANF
jgi:uncharacterized protein (DUF2252 family)